MPAEAAGILPVARLPMAGMAAEIVADPMAVHGEVMTMPAVMVRVMMTVVVDTMVKMRKAVAEKPMSEKSMAEKSVCGHAMTMAGTAVAGDSIALRENDEQKKGRNGRE